MAELRTESPLNVTYDRTDDPNIPKAPITIQDVSAPFPNLIQQGVVTRVHGTATAIEALAEAFYIDQIAISSDIPDKAYFAIEQSLQLLVETGHFPTPEMQRDVQANVNDLYISPESSVQYKSTIPFNFDNLNIDQVLACLRANARLQGENTIYQLGVLTEMDGQATTAELFSMNSATEPTTVAKTVWTHRTVYPIENSVSGHEETWQGFTSRMQDPVFGEVALQGGQPQCNATTSQYPVSQPLFVASTIDYGSYQPLVAAQPVAIECVRANEFWRNLQPGQWLRGTVAPKVSRVGSKASWNNLFLLNGHDIENIVDDILAGAVHPEDICGRLVIEIAKVRSNSDIKEALHALYPLADHIRRVPDKRGAALTKLITMALKAKAGKDPTECGEDDPAYVAEREALNAARKKNGVKFHGGFKAASS